MKDVYAKIETVLYIAKEPIAAHEFGNVSVKIMSGDSSVTDQRMSGRQYIGCTEATISRRLREMRELGRVTAKRREGKAFVEYALVLKEPSIAGHSGGY